MIFFDWKYLLLLIVLLSACKSIPDQKLRQTELDLSYELSRDTLLVHIQNSIHSPISVDATSNISSVDSVLEDYFPNIFPPLSDTTLYFPVIDTSDIKVNFSASFGDPSRKLTPTKISLPFPEGKSYKIIQGYNGSFSHTSSYSKYALDFDLKIGDTVTVADDGFVIGVIEGYKYGGNSRKWRDYANFITVYHPHSGFYTQYVHLVLNGSFVEVGDTLKMGQPIGLSGKTGFSSVEHLHFNVLIPGKSGMISYPIQFIEGYDGRELERGMTVIK